MASAPTLNEHKLKQHFDSCKAAGMPKDQVKLFTESGYFPAPKQQIFHAACRHADELNYPSLILFGGSRSGGKTHGSYCQAGLDDCQRYPGLKVLFLRKIQKAAKESFDDLIGRTMYGIPHKTRNNDLIFDNGSYIMYGGFRTPGDIENYIGQEYDLIIIEELTQISEIDFVKLRGSLRTSRTDGWRPRMYLTTNPGGIGHSWVKKMFVDPYMRGDQTATIYIPSGANDNPHINPEYKKYLDDLPEHLRMMWRDGIWELNEGRAFPQFSEDNVITVAEYQEHTRTGQWIRYCGIDYGVTAPYCCLWIAYNATNGRVIVYREDYQSNLVISEQADRILALTPADEKIAVYYADPAMWGKQSTDTMITSVASMYQDRGLTITRGDNQRVNGRRKVDNLLRLAPDGLPKLMIVDKCGNLIDQMYGLINDPKNLDDVLKCDKDHAYDAFRMGITSIRDVVILEQKMERMKRHPLLDLFPN